MKEKLLSDNFTLEELTFSHTGVKAGIDNSPGAEALKNLKKLCGEVLEPFRKMVGPIRVHSGFRSEKLNKLVRGVPSSQHRMGQAADVFPIKTPLKKAYLDLVDSKIPYDQVIFEFGRWIHASWSPTPRRQALIAFTKAGKTFYENLETYGRKNLA